MVLHRLKALIYALTNRHTRHDNDKLAPAVVFVQFEHCLDIGISLTRTRLHLDGEVYALALQVVNRLQSLLHLNSTHVSLDIAAREFKRRIAKARIE